MSSPDSKSPTKGAARPLAPFGTDDVSPWDQDVNAFTAGKDKVNGSAPLVALYHYISDISNYFFFFF